MKLPRYQSYRDSGVEWIGRVPSHWTLRRIKASVAFSKNGVWGGEPTGSEDDVPCVRVADFDRQRLVVGSVIPTIRNVDSSERNGRVLRAGDLLLEKSGGGEKQPVGQVVQYCQSTPAICSNFVSRVTLREGMVSRFWTYLHFAAYASRVNTRSIKQTSGIQNLDQEQYFNEVCAFPETVEQSAIAAFLDRETTKIDALIAEQERLLELLTEKRQAVISNAVTKGLNPDAPMKDSGVAWLGEVPAHWRVAPLGAITRERCDGPFGSGIKSSHYTDEGALVVRLQNIRSAKFNLGEPVYLDADYFHSELQGHAVAAGDVLVAGLGDDNNLLGRACVAPLGLGPALVKADCFRFRLYEEMCPEFIAYQLSAGAAFDAGILATGTTRSRIPLGAMAGRMVAFPPKEEQQAIRERVDSSLVELDGLGCEIEKAISLLRERRSALIAAAVTGQFDVREAA